MANHKLTLPAGYAENEGTYLLAVGKTIVSGPFSSIAEAFAAKDKTFPDGRHPETGERVDVTYSPTRKEARKTAQRNRADGAFFVSYWRVVEDRRTVYGKHIGAPLSRMFSTRQECRRALAQIKGGNPRAYAARGTFLFNWRSPRDIAARKAMLDEIRGGAA